MQLDNGFFNGKKKLRDEQNWDNTVHEWSVQVGIDFPHINWLKFDASTNWHWQLTDFALKGPKMKWDEK